MATSIRRARFPIKRRYSEFFRPRNPENLPSNKSASKDVRFSIKFTNFFVFFFYPFQASLRSSRASKNRAELSSRIQQRLANWTVVSGWTLASVAEWPQIKLLRCRHQAVAALTVREAKPANDFPEKYSSEVYHRTSTKVSKKKK